MPTDAYPLFERLPSLRHTVERLPLADLPTPVRQLPRLAETLRKRDLWVKDDGLTDGELGGNKVRILELVLPDAARRGERLVAVGPTSSNWVRAACHYARRHGAVCDALVFRQPAGRNAETMLAEIERTAARTHVVAAPPLAAWPLLRIWAEAPRPLLLPLGGSSVLGALAYANAALELEEDVRVGRLPEPDAIVVALGSGGTVAGLLAGLALTSLRTRVVAVRVADLLLANRLSTLFLADRVRRLLQTARECPRRLPFPRLQIVHGQFGGRYGRPTPRGEHVRELAVRLEGLALDPTYTAKAVAAIEALDDPRVLYWHTLGQGALPAHGA